MTTAIMTRENKVEVSDEFTDDYPGLLDAETETEAGIVIQQ